MKKYLRSFLIALNWNNEAHQQKEFVGAIESATLKANLLADGIAKMAELIAGSITSASQNFLQLGNLADQTRVSASNIVALRQAFIQFGGSAAQVDLALQTMSQKMRALNDGNLSYYEKYGINQNKITKQVTVDLGKGQDILQDMSTATQEQYVSLTGFSSDLVNMIRLHGHEMQAEQEKAQKALDAFGFNAQMVQDQSNAARAINRVWSDVDLAWKDLLTTAERPITTQLEKLDKWIKENPDAFKALMILGGGVTAAGGAKVVGGIVARNLFGFGTPAKALTGSAAALTGSARALDRGGG